MNRDEKIDFIKGFVSGTRSPEELLPPEAIYKHIEGFTYENVETGERKELEGGKHEDGSHAPAAYYDPKLGGCIIFCVSVETCYAIRDIK